MNRHIITDEVKEVVGNFLPGWAAKYYKPLQQRGATRDQLFYVLATACGGCGFAGGSVRDKYSFSFIQVRGISNPVIELEHRSGGNKLSLKGAEVEYILRSIWQVPEPINENQLSLF